MIAVGVKEGILALLVEGPKYGYQLKREFETATGEAWTLNVGQVYTTLGRLERDGLVEACGDEQKTHRITKAGIEEASLWMMHPVEPSAANRDEMSMKILLALTSSAADVDDVIGAQRSAAMKNLQDYQRLRTEAADDDLAWLVHLDRLTFQTEAQLRWLDRVESRIEQSGDLQERGAPEVSNRDPAIPSQVGGAHD
ncbi:MAG: PadR family transcriptional regulator [Actinomycetota bacterium]